MSDELLIEAKRFIFPRRTALKPNDYDDLIRRLIARVEASPPIVWTDAKPTVPGWCWWERSPTAGVEIVQVTIGVRLIADIGGRYHPISELPGRWSGPIPHPADAIASASPAS